jgi:hypothetical protein
MLSEETQSEITSIWDKFIETNKTVLDTRGRVINDIDQRRLIAIEDIKGMIAAFIEGKVSIDEFKTSLDGYNKRNNLWGFSAIKGQMFFNQLTKSSEQNRPELVALLKRLIAEPRNLFEASGKLDELESFIRGIYLTAKDKRKVPNPGSIGYFLSYFWQIHDHQEWPIIYTSLTRAFSDLGIWQDHPSQKETYEAFYQLNDDIKGILKQHAHREIDNWDVEHAFSQLSGIPASTSEKSKKTVAPPFDQSDEVQVSSSFELSDYLIPKV